MNTIKKQHRLLRRCAAGLLALGLSFSMMHASVYADEAPLAKNAFSTEKTVSDNIRTAELSQYKTVAVLCNGRDTGYRAYVIENGVTYMPLRTIAGILLPQAEVFWDSQKGAAVVRTSKLNIEARPGELYITANGRYLALSGFYPAENLLIRGVTYVPLRSAVRAMGGEIHWNAAQNRVEITASGNMIQSGDAFYDQDTLYWLSRIIYAEAGDQSLRGQLAVGAVVMNRVRSPEFPNTVYGVIFDKKYGVQFTPTVNGAIYKTPSKESIIAAKLVMDGCMISSEAMYFLDPTIATSFWIVQNCTSLFTIGCHDFYA